MPTDQTTGPCFLDSDPLAGLLFIFWLSCAWMFWTITLLQAKEPCYSTLRMLPWVPTYSHVLAPRMQHFLWVFSPAQTDSANEDSALTVQVVRILRRMEGVGLWHQKMQIYQKIQNWGGLKLADRRRSCISLFNPFYIQGYCLCSLFIHSLQPQ